MSNYQRGKIYQIVCLTTGQKYIGSTTRKTLAERLAGHNRDFKCWKNGTCTFVTSFTILEKGNYQIELLESFPCNSKDELNAREGHHIRTIDCVNKRIEGRTPKEYREDNKTELDEYHKKWREDNKTELDEYQKKWRDGRKVIKSENDKAYREINKVKIAEYKKAYYDANMEQMKAYREKNKARLAEMNKAYYIANKEQIAEQRKAYRQSKKTTVV